MNPTVAAIGNMNFQGNIIPMSWFSHLTFENGKPNTVAIICLSEVIYWYRPVEIRDEVTGKVKGYRQKFKADKWQCSYESMAERFGFTKDQVRNALHFLETKGCIVLEFRHFRADTGTPLSNVLFVEPVPHKIAELNSVSATTSDHIGTETDMGDTISAQKPTHIGTETDTYTETPTETPSDSLSPAQPDFLSDVLAHAQKPKQSGIADPTQDEDRWLQTRKQFIDIYHKRTGLWPNKGVHEPAISKLADAPNADPVFWDSVITAWIGRGYKAGNVDGMIEWYTNHEIPTNGKDKKTNGNKPATGRQSNVRLDAVSQAISDALKAKSRGDAPRINEGLPVLPPADSPPIS